VDLSMFYFPLKKLIRKYAMENLINQGTEMLRINILLGTNVKKVQNYLKNQIYLSLSDT
jgi:hypothetical protein